MAVNAILIESVTIVDLLLVASLGEVSVAAFGIGGALVAFFMSIQFAIGNGTQLMLSRAVGSGSAAAIGRQLGCGWVLCVGFSLLALLLLHFGAGSLFDTIAPDQQVASLALSYVEVALLGILLAAISNPMVACFNARGLSRIPLYGFLLEIPVNIASSVVLIHGLWGAPRLGLAGAAWGSVLAIALRVLYLSWQLNRDRLRGRVTGMLSISLKAVHAHFREVFPMVANFLVLFSGMLMFQALFAQLSIASYAAITLILPWIKIGSLFVNSWTQSSTILVSRKLGGDDFASIPSLIMQTKLVATIMCVLMVGLYYGISQLLPIIHRNLSQETLLALSVIAPAYILLPLFRVNNMFCGNMIRALGESYLIVRINIITQWLLALPICALLVYLEAPLVLVFGVILLDEILKFLPFRNTLMRKLRSLPAQPSG